MPSVASLKRRLAQTLKTRRLDAALGALTQLARMQPRDPSWPTRAARIMHATSDYEGEMAALRRALELQIDQGRVLDAIATCRSILALCPDDPQAIGTLDLLSPHGLPMSAGVPLADDEATNDEPLETLLLSDMVSDAQSFRLADTRPGRINEIPIEDGARATAGIRERRLDPRDRTERPEDLAAAQVASLAKPAEPSRRASSRAKDRGAALRRALARTPIFGDLDAANLETLIRHVRVVDLAAGQILFRQGDAANCLYVIVKGAVVPIAEGERRRRLAVLEHGAFFGEIGILTKQPRNATIEALVETKLLAIDRRLLWKLISSQPAIAKSLLRFLRARMLDRQIRTHPLFAALAHGEREVLAREFRILEVTDGTRVIAQGRPAGALFVVLAGSLDRVDRERRQTVGGFGLGDVFGGWSLLVGGTESADVVARGKCWLMTLGEERFRRLVGSHPRLARTVRTLAREDAVHRTSAPAL